MNTLFKALVKRLDKDKKKKAIEKKEEDIPIDPKEAKA